MDKPAAILITATLITAAAPSHAAKWEKDGSKAGVTVYKRSVEGSKIPQVKAVTTVDASTDEVWEYLSTGLKKSKKVKVAKNLGSCGANCKYVYHRLTHPLIKDRHYVIKMKWSVTGAEGQRTYKRTWKKTNEKKVESKGSMLVEKISGSWHVKPIEGGTKTRLTYVNHMDLGGSVPSGMFSNGFIKQTYKILKRIRKAL
jgi:hypothetical protein